ncbi:MAG: hypothetical protein Kow0026_21970 [Oricola sp.]
MTDRNSETGTSRIRALSRRLSRHVSLATAAGIAGTLAVTPLVATAIAHLSGGAVSVPGHARASVSGMPALHRSGQAAHDLYPELAEGGPGNRPVSAPRAAAGAEPTGRPRPTRHFADPDPRRLAMRPAPDGTAPAVADYAWIPGQPATVALASLESRFGEPAWSAAQDAMLPALADTTETEDDGASVPLPVQRPRIAAAPATEAGPASAAIDPAAPLPERRPAHSAPARKDRSAAALAYANPDAEVEEEKRDGIFGRLFGRRGESLLPGRGSKVAVYDISAATVYMPNGEKLEAHSGLAHMKDNPRYVAEKNRGPTPPNLYNLKMRESRFHGVEAIRLLPADGKKKYNRDGLLAHTYMYVRNGGKDKSQSNGCVVFKDYDRFLNAFKRGEIEHLIVVPNLKEVPTYMAAL